MANSVNKVILVGNLGVDPETHVTPQGNTVTKVRLATSKRWNDSSSGEPQEHTEWHSIKFFGKTAEIAAQYLYKGRQIFVEGEIRTDKYTDKNGEEKYFVEIIGHDMQMLGAKE